MTALLVCTMLCSASAVSDRRHELYTWFDSLGFPEVSSGKFIRIEDRNDSRAKITYAFQRSPGQPSYTNFSLAEGSLSASHLGPLKPTFKAGDFKHWLETSLTIKDDPEAPPDDIEPRLMPYHISGVQWFVASRAANARGLDQLAMRAFFRFEGSGHRSTLELKNMLVQAFSTTLFCQASMLIEDPAVPRSRILAKFVELNRKFPDGPDKADAEAAIAILQRMTAEDAVHKRVHRPLSQLPEDEQIAELVYRLRDQEARAFSIPGTASVFERWGTPRDTPADKLVAFGVKAVPKLIEALGDHRYVRGMLDARSITIKGAMRIGDAAAEILEKITGASFGWSPYSGNWAENQRAIRAEAEAWLADRREKGELFVLSEGARRGDRGSYEQAERLVKNYPEEALEAIKEGVRNAHEGWIRANLIESLRPLKTLEATTYLREQMANGADLQSRLAAARALKSRDRKSAVDSMIGEWGRLHTGALPGADQEDSFVSGELIDFLAGAVSAKAVDTLNKYMAQTSIDERVDIVLHLAPAQSLSGADREIYLRAVERLLVSRLTDIAAQEGATIGFGEERFDSPRVADLACYQLGQFFPKKYRFVNSGSTFDRDVQLKVALNKWRSEAGMPLEPLPTRAMTKLKPSESLRVTYVQLSGETSLVSETTRVIQNIKGRILSTAFLVETLKGLVKHWPTGIRGISLDVYRGKDLTGVQVFFSVEGRKEQKLGQQWEVGHTFTASGESLGSMGMSASRLDSSYFAGQAKWIHRLLSTPPTTEVRAWITIRH